MDVQRLIGFFKWCSIINGGLLALTFLMMVGIPDLVYKIHASLFSLTREFFDSAMYAFLGLYKILFLVFNLIPYVALRLINGNDRSSRHNP